MAGLTFPQAVLELHSQYNMTLIAISCCYRYKGQRSDHHFASEEKELRNGDGSDHTNGHILKKGEVGYVIAQREEILKRNEGIHVPNLRNETQSNQENKTPEADSLSASRSEQNDVENSRSISSPTTPLVEYSANCFNSSSPSQTLNTDTNTLEERWIKGEVPADFAGCVIVIGPLEVELRELVYSIRLQTAMVNAPVPKIVWFYHTLPTEERWQRIVGDISEVYFLLGKIQYDLDKARINQASKIILLNDTQTLTHVGDCFFQDSNVITAKRHIELLCCKTTTEVRSKIIAELSQESSLKILLLTQEKYPDFPQPDAEQTTPSHWSNVPNFL